jgi:hypothetical protein
MCQSNDAWELDTPEKMRVRICELRGIAAKTRDPIIRELAGDLARSSSMICRVFTVPQSYHGSPRRILRIAG